MTALELQRVLARLVVDDAFHRRFTADRASLLTELALGAEARDRLELLDAAALDTFRDVVRGSRVRQFALFFRHLAGRVGDDDAWTSLVMRFQSEVVIRDARDLRDAEAFCGWLAAEWPGSVAAELAAYEMRLLRIGAPRDAEIPPGTVRKHPCVETLLAHRPVEALLTPDPGPLWTASADAAPGLFLVLKTAFGAAEVEVLEGNALVHHALELLRRPRRPEVVRQRLGQPDEVFDELWDTLLGAGLVVADV